jgi:hypothetical protein
MVSLQSQARFETTKRLLFHLVNEGLVDSKLQHDRPNGNCYLYLQRFGVSKGRTSCVKVAICPGAVNQIRDDQVVSLLNPEALAAPVILEKWYNGALDRWAESDPGTLFEFMYPWFADDNQDVIREQIVGDLRNSAANQGEIEASI